MSILAALFLITLSPAEPDMCPLVDDLNRVVVLETGYLPPPCPVIRFDLPRGSEGLRSQAGAYFPDSGAIALDPDLDLTGALGQSYLLHELVHAAQYANGAHHTARCPAALEAEAYTAQSNFLRSRGLERDGLLMFMLASHLGACGTAEP